MLSLIYTATKYAVEYAFSTKEDKNLNEVINCIQNAYIRDASKNENLLLNTDNCIRKTGIVSSITPLYTLVDNQYICQNVNVWVKDLRIADKVEYLIENANQLTQSEIKRIVSVVDDSWEKEYDISKNTNYKRPKVYDKSQAIQRVIVGKVIKRANRIVFIEPPNVSIDLNKIESEFIPIVGDWLQLESLIELDEESVDLSGDIIEVKKIRPLRSKLDIGVVTSYDCAQGVGIIEKSIIFTKGACDVGYVPCVGDKVVTDNIESDQGVYTWRSLSVVPMMQAVECDSQSPMPQSYQIKNKDLHELLKDKHGIVISNNLRVNLNIHEEKTITITVQNTSDSTHVLQQASFLSKNAQSQLIIEQPVMPDSSTTLKPCDTITYRFKCTAKFLGSTEELFTFDFEDFQIGRIFYIKVNAVKRPGNKQQAEQSDVQTRDWNQMPVFDESNEVTCIPGVRPYKPAAFVKVRDVRFTVPRRYWDVILRNAEQRKHMAECANDLEKIDPCLVKPLRFDTYKARFHTLLYLEDIEQTINIQRYAMDSVVMRRSGDYLVLEVPGLAEKRPSLLVGDRAVVSFKWDNSNGNLKYEGCIHKVTNSEIFLKFNDSFHQKYNNEDCEVAFKCSQSAIQRGHNAVNSAITRLGPNILFPMHVIQKPPQLNIEEIEPTDNVITDGHESSNSISSDSSSTSTSISTTSTKSSRRIPVIKRLFNVDPGERNTDSSKGSEPSLHKNSNTGSSRSQNGKTSKNALTTGNLTKTVKECEFESCIAQIKKRKLCWFNKQLNFYQKNAIRNILKGYARPLPYIIFGPPGTGKTVTLCEAILQIFTMIPESRILIATPSNSSANLIAERLLDSGILKPGDMVRLIAHHCLGSDTIPDCLWPYCATADLAEEGTRAQNNFSEHTRGAKLNCTKSILGRHRITIGTCIAVGVLNNIGFPRGHFSHVLIDEAGQATEPEIMVPLNFIHSDSGQIVLAGDPQQLGPVVVSKFAQSYGLDVSFLSRLLNHFPYQKDPDGFERLYDPRVVTKLLMNYRSLPEILYLASSLFYDSELQPQVSPTQSKEAMLLQTLIEELPKREEGPPAVIFHGVDGENCRDTASPSWYNPEEATQVYLYLLKLYKCGLTADDIGIISPYQKQVVQIRDLLLELDVPFPKISSVEGFQGQERNVIIISTVRSCNSFVNEDIRHSLGFISCPRRVNVAITRARALLIILGNPNLLAQDPYWRSILRYCTDRGAYIGYNSFS